MASFLGELSRGRILPVVAGVAVVAAAAGLVVRALLNSGERQSEPLSQVTAITDPQARSEALRTTGPPSAVVSNEAASANSVNPRPENTVDSTGSEQLAPKTRTVPIPVPGRLMPWFQSNQGRSNAHAQLEAERREPAWATFNETLIASFLGDNLEPQNYEILSLECRTQTCEVLAVGYGQLVDGGPRHTAADAFFASVLPGLMDAAWSSFTDADMSFEPIDSGAVGIQLILHQNPQSSAPNQSPVQESTDSIIRNVGEDSGREVRSGNGVVRPIPVADELAPLFQQNDDWAEFHERLEREADNLSWSTFMEDQIAEFLSSQASLAGHDLLLAECRTSSCEVQFTVPYSGPGPWQFDLLAIDRQPWFEFESWEMNGGSNSQDSMTLILRLDGVP